MQSKEWLKDRERALEDEYFWRKDRDLIAKLREQAQQEKERGVLRKCLGITDEAFLADLQAAGFTPDNLGVLHLVPLVEVAWAEGEVTARERELILALAARRGVSADSSAYKQLLGWLDRYPGVPFFETAFKAVRATLAKMEGAARAAAKRDLVEWSTRIAEATGGILGMIPVSQDERECLERINDRLTSKQRALASRRLSHTSRRKSA